MRAMLLFPVVLAALSAAAAANDISGTPGDDFLDGTPQAGRIEGLGGHDEILARAGDDVLGGGDGNDELFGGEGDNVADAGAGNDPIDGRGGNVMLTGGPGPTCSSSTRVGSGDDIITDFGGADDTILLDGFTAADVEVRAAIGGTTLVLGDRGQIGLPGVARIDEDDLAFR